MVEVIRFFCNECNKELTNEGVKRRRVELVYPYSNGIVKQEIDLCIEHFDAMWQRYKLFDPISPVIRDIINGKDREVIE